MHFLISLSVSALNGLKTSTNLAITMHIVQQTQSKTNPRGKTASFLPSFMYVKKKKPSHNLASPTHLPHPFLSPVANYFSRQKIL